MGHNVTSVSALFTGDLTRAAELARAGFALYRPEDHRSLFRQYGFDPGAGCLDWASMAYQLLGNPDRAQALNDEGLRMVTALGHPWSAVFFHAHRPILDYLRCDPAAALEHARSCIVLCDQSGVPDRKAEAQVFEGWALAALGEAELGIGLINQGRAYWQFVGARIGDPIFLYVLATAQIAAGRLAEAQSAVEEGLAQIAQSGERAWEADLHRLAGELSLKTNGPNTAHAQACFLKALELARELKARIFELRAAASLARLWESQVRRQEALDLLAPIYNWFTEGFGTRDLKDAKSLLDELRQA